MLKRLICPSCGAQLSPPGTAVEVTCGYCGTTCSIAKPGVKDRLTVPRAPVAVYKTPRWAYALYLLPVLGILTGVGIAIFGAVEGQPFGLSGLVHWDPMITPELVDINGDGTRDIIGRVRTFKGSELAINFAAYDGRTGDQLWMTAIAGDFSLEHSSLSRIVDDTLLFGDSLGQLHAYAIATGAPLWTVGLGERTTMICRPPPAEGDDAQESQKTGQAIVVTADEVVRSMVLASGEFQPAEAAPAECGDPPRGPGTYGYSERKGVLPWAPRPNDDGPEPPPGTQLYYGFATAESNIGLGVKAPGTAVPMIAVYDDHELRWSSVIPPSDPLAAATGPVELAIADDELVVVLYELEDRDKGSRLNARSLEDGKLRWDVQIPNSHEVPSTPEMLITDGDLLLVPHWTWLEVFKKASGEHLYTIGRWR